MSNCKPSESPTPPSTKLFKYGGEYFYDHFLFRSVLGALQPYKY